MCEDRRVSQEWISGERVRLLREAVGMTLLFSISCIAVFGCASSQSTATVAAAGTAADNAVSVGKAHARAYARQVNITQADVPGAALVADEEESGPPSQKALEVARCAGAVVPNRRIADIKSSTLRVGTVVDEATRVKSSIEVQPSAAIAARNYAALQSARDRRCIARDLPQLAEGAGTAHAHIGPTTVSVLQRVLPEGQNAFGFRIKTTITGASAIGQQMREVLYIDDYGFVAGRAEVSLNDIRTSRPPPTELERHLLTVLYSRAKAHKL
jgi:hypothetical protein